MRPKIFLIIMVASVIAFIVGPIVFFESERKVAEGEFFARAGAVAQLLAEANKDALSGGRDVLYNLEIAKNEPGVKETFITDIHGFVVAPAARFHENITGDALVRSVLQGAKYADHRDFFGGYRLVVPILSGDKLVGVAGILFSGFNMSAFKYLWALFRLAFTSIAVMAVAAYAIAELFSNKSIQGPVKSVESERASHEITAADLAGQMDFSVVFFDSSFKVIFANERAASFYPDIVEKHMVDIGGVFLDMVEEMEMLQVGKIRRGDIILWRHRDGEQTKGYVFFNV